MKVTATATKVKITSKLATEILDKHERLVQSRGLETLNRTINDSLVQKYATDMRNGKWELNGETIKIAETGRVLDGQHRLWAAANHDVSFESLIVSGLDEESFYTIDIGRSRKPSDFLTSDGIPNGANAAAGARLVIGYRRKSMQLNHMITTHEIVHFVQANPRIAQSAGEVHGIHRIAPVSCATAWHFLFSEQNKEQADIFIKDMIEGVGLAKGDPVLALRERLIKNKSSKARLPGREIFILGLKAWNDRRAGKTRTKVQTTRNDASEVKLPKVA